MITGNVQLLEKHAGYGNLLAMLRNTPEMDQLYSIYCFENGSRGRGNGKVASSPLGGSNIWLADDDECVIIYQADKGRGPLAIKVYASNPESQTYLSDSVWQIIHQHSLPYVDRS